MSWPDIPILFHWFDETVQLVQRLAIVVVAAFIAVRIKGLRLALRGNDLKWQHQLMAILVFGLLAIVGTHSGVVIDVGSGNWQLKLTSEVPLQLNINQAIVGFRDTMVLVAGLIAGPWVGFGAGLIASAERYHLGGFAALSSGTATTLLGLYAGLIRYFRAKWIATAKGVFLVVIFASLLHRTVILLLVQPFDIAMTLTWEVLVPVTIVNCMGCVLFFWIMRDLERDQFEREIHQARLLAVQAELRALRAQVDPHFLNNTLNDLNALIRMNPDKARFYVCELADFFKYTRQFSELTSISLADEVAQLQRFLTLQRLGLGEKLQDTISIPEALLDLQILPGCLLTLTENALKHGFKSRPAPYRLSIKAEQIDEQLLLQVSDNGRGIADERLPKLGKQTVDSENSGSGVALFQLQQSLVLAFGDKISLNVDSIPDQGTTVSLQQPIRHKI